MALPFEQAVGFNVIVVLIDLAGALELMQGFRGRF
jgi:hypothetical protein